MAISACLRLSKLAFSLHDICVSPAYLDLEIPPPGEKGWQLMPNKQLEPVGVQDLIHILDAERFLLPFGFLPLVFIQTAPQAERLIRSKCVIQAIGLYGTISAKFPTSRSVALEEQFSYRGITRLRTYALSAPRFPFFKSE
jgi:hypothetical protein